MTTYTDEEKQEAIATVNAFTAQEEVYATTHEDAGEAYRFMIENNCLNDLDGLASYIGWMLDNRIKGEVDDIDSPEEVRQHAFDNCVMISGHYMSEPTCGHVIASFPVGEIEVQLDSMDDPVDWELLMMIDNDCDAHISGGGYAYVNTDAVWYAVVKPNLSLGGLHRSTNAV